LSGEVFLDASRKRCTAEPIDASIAATASPAQSENRGRGA
jgi:hypothetical protein